LREIEKRLPEYGRYLGEDLIHTLRYWLKGDGWRNGAITIGATTSKALGLAMRDIAFSCGQYAVIRKTKRHRYGVPNKDQYWVEVYDERPMLAHQRELSEHEFGSRISGKQGFPKIHKSNFSGRVYNLQVAEDESFVANGIVVHNCVISAGLSILGSVILAKSPTRFGEEKMKAEKKAADLKKLNGASRSAAMELDQIWKKVKHDQENLGMRRR